MPNPSPITMARPRMRYIQGYWRVTSPPVKFGRLTREQQQAWVKMHDHAHKLNALPGRGVYADEAARKAADPD